MEIGEAATTTTPISDTVREALATSSPKRRTHPCDVCQEPVVALTKGLCRPFCEDKGQLRDAVEEIFTTLSTNK